MFFPHLIENELFQNAAENAPSEMTRDEDNEMMVVVMMLVWSR